MVDLETMGTVADAAICSIGAVRFDLESDELDDAGFSASISLDSNSAVGRRIQEDTFLWWLKQSAEAQAFFHGPKQSLESSLIDLSDWIGNDTYYVWSNGADFDLPMLMHAYAQFNLEVPWRFTNSRCYRTYKNLPCAKNVPLQRVGTHHNALFDALNQARHIQKIHAVMTGRVVLPKHRMEAA